MGALGQVVDMCMLTLILHPPIISAISMLAIGSPVDEGIDSIEVIVAIISPMVELIAILE